MDTQPNSPEPTRGDLDESKRRRIIELVSAGCSYRTAARFVGCHPAIITRTAQRDPTSECHHRPVMDDLPASTAEKPQNPG